MKTRKNIRGFSLIELMIVVALITLFLVAAVPSIRLYLESTKVRNVAESIERGLQRTKFYAVKNNVPVEFVLNTAAQSWTIWQLDTTATPAKQTLLLETFVWGDGTRGHGWTAVSAGVIPATALDDGQARVTFGKGSGWLLRKNLSAATVPPKNITVTSAMEGTRRLQVDVLMTGGVRVCDRDLPEDDYKSCRYTALL
ncbi:MAG: prepilin-type N-terminal cleavage/methylation domain-containing protein [Burkholderiales bacterium]|jgi:prepilin-type N-terminal cleavage/methylation domain-containing protein|nr:prepilin-type N-terminal cleavage/methylation domain-containing protein [Burkholderiales bacterium]